VQFIDICPVLATPAALKELVDALQARYSQYGLDRICGGFFFGAPLALALGLPFVPVRKPGKLPGETITSSYTKFTAPTTSPSRPTQSGPASGSSSSRSEGRSRAPLVYSKSAAPTSSACSIFLS
jgi:hypothetical protein